MWVGCSCFSLWNAVFVLLLLLVNDGKIVYLLMCGKKFLELDFSIHNCWALFWSLEVSENFRDEGIVPSFRDFMFGPVTSAHMFMWFHFPLLLLSCYTFWTYAKKTIIETCMTVVYFNLRIFLLFCKFSYDLYVHLNTQVSTNPSAVGGCSCKSSFMVK